MPSLSSSTGRRVRRTVNPKQQARIQSEAEGVADVTGPPTPPGLQEHDEAMAGAKAAASPARDLKEENE